MSDPYQSSYAGYSAPREHPQGLTIIILGALSFVIGCLPLGIPAWIMGNKALKEIDAYPIGTYSNRSLVVVGRILGIISSIITGLLVLVLVTSLVVAAAGSGS
ncbi:hypothetical protein [Luteipulveratus mongoliensis]|uniref:DUF4190 domain-containing protein n=1 Tax=Luteipulveratus mongoliensis TaxID=571913 RepID=A0A0K1JNL1_9MICO|nr:hypothetical protein [Luteipulveratus mongoliensis]AKU18175.1 hypothetical protein VV02_23865 [Luteipulveratus mongoliensis]